jgi:predicted RNA-binding Zn-ribbon protein involved in translation (DUF1610 family)
MTDLERFAATLLAQWRTDEIRAEQPITVAAILDQLLPYRVARRLLGIDVSEDYEALVLRLVAEEGRLVVVEPTGAAEMARNTMASKLPDLANLELLRSATLEFTDDTMARLDGVLPMPAPREDSRWAPPSSRAGSEVIPLHASAPAAPPAPPRRDEEPAVKSPAESGPPPEFLTTVAFTPPSDSTCWTCHQALPAGRQVKFCPFCGADQRQPKCRACGEPVEREWHHCPECGSVLWSG